MYVSMYVYLNVQSDIIVLVFQRWGVKVVKLGTVVVPIGFSTSSGWKLTRRRRRPNLILFHLNFVLFGYTFFFWVVVVSLIVFYILIC